MARERIRLPESIERGRLLAAIKRIDQDGFAPHQQSTTYDLVHDGRRYPPIAVVAFAMEDLTGRSVAAAAIRGGEGTQTFTILRDAGFGLEAKTSDLPRNADEPWTTQELRSAVAAYFDMLDKVRSGTRFVKKKYYHDLAEEHGRTEKSFEFRMQNISAVLSVLGREWLPGLKPAVNVGPTVTAQLEDLIAEVDGRLSTGRATFEAKVKQAQKKRPETPPKGNRKPKKISSTSTAYSRDPDVVAWILDVADGKCECCESCAPFLRYDGSPFLEVHHLRRLADGGADRVENAVAVCPNCHRALHYSRGKGELLDAVYKRVARLEREG